MQSVFLAAFSPKLNVIYCFSTEKYSEVVNLSRTLAPLQGEIGICVQGLFCTKFNPKQLLFEGFLAVMRIFGSVESQSKSNFPFSYVIRFQTY